MLDIKKIRENSDSIEKALKDRHFSFDFAALLAMDQQRRQLIAESEAMKEQMNRAGDKISALKKEKKDASPIIKKMQEIKIQVQEKDTSLAQIEQSLGNILLNLPNVPHPSVPVGNNAQDNKVIREHGEKKKYSFKPKDHVDIGKQLNILDFETAAKLSGTRFALLRGDGALLERSLIRFMLDVHIKKHGYTEIMPPLLVTPSIMQGTGQLPKFEEELFKCKDDSLYLIPTAEVPLTGIHKDEIIPESSLPIKYVAYTPCFRREAGSYGKDTRGLIRNHQFNKVELVKIVAEEHSLEELEKLLENAEEILKQLHLPYRVIELCTADMGFASAKTYDLEVWMPGEQTYREVSSCSLCSDFQARRLNIRYRTRDNKIKFVHTLNGSGLAIGRMFAAIIENYQESDGSVTIPEVLCTYMGKTGIMPH